MPYEYNIGTYEVTAGQYTEFLNAVAGTDTYGLYNTDMWSNSYGCRIDRSGSSDSYTYSVVADRANRPVNFISWGDAARFANWLHNGQPIAPQESSTTEDGSYDLNGAMTDEALVSVSREADSTWVIPSEDEWYKAAYYKGGGTGAGYWDYPTQGDTAPTRELPPGQDMTNGSANYGGEGFVDPIYYTTEAGAYDAKPSDSAYGTFDQGGNVREWSEAMPTTLRRGHRGGSYTGHGSFPAYYLHAAARDNHPASSEERDIGFRVAYVPEPACATVLAVGGLALLRRKR